MRIAVFSDLHLEFNDWVPPRLDCDVLVLAGDIDVLGQFADVPRWARRRFPEFEIIWILGNHEYYQYTMGMGACLDLARRQAKASKVYLLENEAVVIDTVRFLGCTLWTDFRLHGGVVNSAAEATLDMNDFCGAIRVEGDDGRRRWFRPEDSIEIHCQSVAWLDQELSKPFEGKTVVVTHHSPHPKCEHRFYAASPLSPAFCSDLGWLIEKHRPALWISGHTHASHDIRIGKTRLVSNQRGYRDIPEHADAPFNPNLIIEI